MNLATLYKIFAVLHAVMALMMLFGGPMISNMNGWDHSIGIVTMAEHHGAALLCVSLLFWMLPRWLSEEGLKDATSTALLVQAILAVMPIYHATVGAIPADASLAVMMIVLLGLMYLFLQAAKKDPETK
ncbi:MAG: hypothetical protein HOK66_07505 [Marinovum sp.]|nr:hypothetical protein [Marinovum sp.]